MKSGSNWIKKEISNELNIGVEEKIEGYYWWRLATRRESYAHVFFSQLKNQKELEGNWENIINQIAFYVQSEQISLLERSNFYVWFFVDKEISASLQKTIEDDTYSSQKFVVAGKGTLTIEEKLDLIQNRLFTFRFGTEKSLKKMIAKVEIQNFRTYKGNKIFDFKGENGLARLVVLYAPNGSGKTSFFDGIEWSLTGSVDRFRKIANKSVDGEILKNTEAEKDEEASVALYFDDGHWVKRKVSKVNNKTQKDIGTGRIAISPENELKEYIGNIDKWKNLILQHHKIDGFIAATKPQELYKEWGSLWDPNNEKRKNFEESYRRKQQEQKNFEEINKSLEEIKQKHQKLLEGRAFAEKLAEDVREFEKLSGKSSLGNLDFRVASSNEYVIWSNQVDIEMDLYQGERVEQKELLQYVYHELVSDGENYQKILLLCQQAREKQKKATQNLQSCLVKKQLIIQKKEIEEKRTQLAEQKEEYLVLQKQGEEWYQQAKKYFEIFESQNVIKGNLQSVSEDKILPLESEIEKLQVEFRNKQNVIEEDSDYHRLCKHFEELKEIKKGQERLDKQLKNFIDDQNQDEKQVLIIEEREQNFKEKKIDSFDMALEKYKSGRLANQENNIELDEKRQELYQSLKDYVEQKEKLDKTFHSILVEGKVEEEISNILEEARKIIEKQNRRACPVCNTQFQSPEELLENTYRIVSLKGEDLKKRKKEQEEELKRSKVQVLQNLEIYQEELNKIILGLTENKQDLRSGMEKKKEQGDILRIQLQDKKERSEQIQKEDQEQGIYVVYTKEGIESWHSLWNAKQNSELLELDQKLKEAKKQLKVYSDMKERFCQKLKSNQELLQLIITDMEDSFIILQKSESLIKEKNYIEIGRMIIECEEKSENLLKKQQKLEDELDCYQEFSITMEEIYRKEKIDSEEEIQVREKQAKEILKRIQKVFKEKINNNFVLEIEKIKSIEEGLNAENQRIQNIIEVLERLKYNNEVEKYFSEWKESDQLLKDTINRKEKQEKIVMSAEQAYNVEVGTIQQNMQEFLNQFQVSDIYEKLEPHEELKTLVSEFCFNDDEKPELSFQVSDKKGKTYPPEWYFSTAQLNVVAFSVFLGRALQAENEPIKSILIDDPVGHFDDMNIVGFVNLLWNIIENTDRQLIISTHEERVFRLIQRKIPKEDYPVKYIDFRKEILNM